MGDRGEVLIEDEGVYLYSHWGADVLPQLVARALAREARWGDPEYLAAIVAREMLEPNLDTNIGFGIGSTPHGDRRRRITIRCRSDDGREVVYEDREWLDKGNKRYNTVFEGPFEEYIDAYHPDNDNDHDLE